jgi:predicted dehydrogenase
MITRRNFVRDTALTAFGVSVSAVAPADLMAQKRGVPAGDRLVVGLIGCKQRGFVNLRNFLLQPEVQCAAMCDVDRNILETRTRDILELQEKKPDHYGDYRKLLERKDIDAVIISTPDHWHCLPFVDACRAGKDVYVEKPLANSITECRVMLEAARKYERVVQVGQQQRSGVHWKAAMDFIRSGKLGKIRRVNIWGNFNYGAGREKVPDSPVPHGVDYDMWLGPAPERSFNASRFHGSWRMFWDYGGGLMTDWGVHLIDMALWAMDVDYFPKSVVASGGIFAHRDRALETPDTLNVLYEMDNFLISWENNGGVNAGPFDQNYGLAYVGTNGTLVIDRSKWRVFPEGKEDDRRMEDPGEFRSDRNSSVNHVKDFIKCVKNREKPAADIRIGHNVGIYAHLGNLAYKTGGRLVYDVGSNTVSGNKAATEMLTPEYRRPWKLPVMQRD